MVFNFGWIVVNNAYGIGEAASAELCKGSCNSWRAGKYTFCCKIFVFVRIGRVGLDVVLNTEGG